LFLPQHGRGFMALRHDAPDAFCVGCGSGAVELAAEIDRRLRPLEEVGERQIVLDIWVLRELLNRLPGMAVESPPD
jgi:hypothetical protein